MPQMEGPFAVVSLRIYYLFECLTLVYNTCTYIQAKQNDRPHVDTVRIPCDGSRPIVANFLVTGAGTTEVPFHTCNKGEKSLVAFPQVWACEKSTRKFSWKHRSLTSLFVEDIGRQNGGWGGCLLDVLMPGQESGYV